MNDIFFIGVVNLALHLADVNHCAPIIISLRIVVNARAMHSATHGRIENVK